MKLIALLAVIAFITLNFVFGVFINILGAYVDYPMVSLFSHFLFGMCSFFICLAKALERAEEHRAENKHPVFVE